jgi:hypothetical protein
MKERERERRFDNERKGEEETWYSIMSNELMREKGEGEREKGAEERSGAEMESEKREWGIGRQKRDRG